MPLDVLVGIRRRAKSDVSGWIQDRDVYLTLDGISAVGSNQAKVSTHWPAAFGTAWYGGLGDFWGLVGVTAAAVTSANFGVMLIVQGVFPGGESVGTHTVTAEVAEIVSRVYYLSSVADESRVCFSERSLELRSDGCFRQHPTDDVWGPVVEEGPAPVAPSGRASRKARTIIVPSQGDFTGLADSGSNKLTGQAFTRRAYLFAREAAD